MWPLGVVSWMPCLALPGPLVPPGTLVPAGAFGALAGCALQPGDSFVWLQASQSPAPLPAVVAPPPCQGTIWSRCRMGASQYGVRHVSSRASMNRRSPAGKSLARESIATNSPEPGAVYRRRIQVVNAWSAAASEGTAPLARIRRAQNRWTRKRRTRNLQAPLRPGREGFWPSRRELHRSRAGGPVRCRPGRGCGRSSPAGSQYR